MFSSKIIRRLILSFLSLTLLSLSVLGIYLLHYFHMENMQRKTGEMTTQIRIVQTALENDPLLTGNPQAVKNKIQQFSSASGLRLTYIDPSGTVLADTAEDPGQLDNHFNRQEIRQAFETGFGSIERYSDTLHENMLYIAVPVRQNGQVTGMIRLASSLAPIEDAYDHTRQSILSSLLISALIAILLGFFLGQRQSRPIHQMTRDAREITNGNLEKRLHIHTKDELEVLASTINNLTANLAQKIREARSENHKLTLILENMDNAVMLLDAQGNITTANSKACRLFQLTEQHLKKHSINAIGNSLLSETAQEVLQNRQPRSINFHTTVQGTKKTFTVFFAPFFEESSGEVLSVFHDISMLQELSDRQTKFVANAAHELATPLTSICGFAETLLDSDLADPVLNRKFILIISKEAGRMNRLIKDLLQLAKLDSQEYRSQIETSAVDCTKLLEMVSSRMQNQLQQKKQTLEVQQTCSSAIIEANEDLFLQILLNLTENAIKYTGEQGHIVLRCTISGQNVEISVRDNGMGIAPSDLPFVFQRFYRADKARKRVSDHSGSGIGLSLVQFIVELFGGKIRVESALEEGTIFTITLPLKA